MSTPPSLADLCVRCIGEKTQAYEILKELRLTYFPVDTYQDLLMLWSWKALMVNHEFVGSLLKNMRRRSPRCFGKSRWGVTIDHWPGEWIFDLFPMGAMSPDGRVMTIFAPFKSSRGGARQTQGLIRLYQGFD